MFLQTLEVELEEKDAGGGRLGTEEVWRKIALTDAVVDEIDVVVLGVAVEEDG